MGLLEVIVALTIVYGEKYIEEYHPTTHAEIEEVVEEYHIDKIEKISVSKDKVYIGFKFEF